MLDQKLIRENPKLVEELLSRRGSNFDLNNLNKLTVKVKEVDIELSNYQSESKKLSKIIGQYYKSDQNINQKVIEDLKSQANKLKSNISRLEELKRNLNSEITDEILKLPNLPSAFTPQGKDENENIEIRKWGEIIAIKNIKSHSEIGEKLNLFDSKRSSRISRSRFITLSGNGAKLERSLINFMLDYHSKNGYLELMPPALINSESLTGSGQLPKFSNESFRCAQDDLWLSPTAEVPLTAFHKEEIIDSTLLPIKYVAYSPCFRREAGSYGKDTKGLIRLHQFNKVELYWYTKPEDSNESHEVLTSDAEAILKELNLPYRVIELCSGDLGFSASRTYDIEVWMPSSSSYREISSCSNCNDFQSRRSSIRTKIDKKTTYLHTLNGSGLAIGRTMAAILENGQQEDGSIKIPDVLIPYFGSSYINSN